MSNKMMDTMEATSIYTTLVCSTLLGQVMIGERGKAIREKWGDVTVIDFLRHAGETALNALQASGFDTLDINAIKTIERGYARSAVDAIAFRKVLLLLPEYERRMLGEN